MRIFKTARYIVAEGDADHLMAHLPSSPETPYTPQIGAMSVNHKDEVYHKVREEQLDRKWAGAELQNTGNPIINQQTLVNLISQEITENGGDHVDFEEVGGGASEHFGTPVEEPSGRVADYNSWEVVVNIYGFLPETAGPMDDDTLALTLEHNGLPDHVTGSSMVDDHSVRFSASVSKIRRSGKQVFVSYRIELEDM